MAETELDLVVAYCSDRDIKCPHCAYNLRDLKSPACPECGEKVVLEVRRKERGVTWAFTITLFAVAICAGCGLPWWIYPARVGRVVAPWLKEAFVEGTWTCFGLALALLLLNRWFRSRSTVVQWTLAAIALAMMLAVVLIQWSANFD